MWPIAEALQAKIQRRDVEALVRSLNDNARRTNGIVDFAEVLLGLSSLFRVRGRVFHPIHFSLHPA